MPSYNTLAGSDTTHTTLGDDSLSPDACTTPGSNGKFHTLHSTDFTEHPKFKIVGMQIFFNQPSASLPTKNQTTGHRTGADERRRTPTLPYGNDNRGSQYHLEQFPSARSATPQRPRCGGSDSNRSDTKILRLCVSVAHCLISCVG